ncbi:WD40 repeat-like protein [Coprinellus micaceus]|uniref:WD40 repeat-like protein n=1 Tax=Coprinellus micaceus TaxID=71717 RepID=A0A4Y7T626_COPMI|nr:WD40 repeat-like protein [Coprinellus micaceus]
MNLTAPKLVPSPSFTSSNRPLRSSSFASSSSTNGPSEEAYILSISSLNDGAQYAVATSSPTNAIHIVDAQSLRVLTSLKGPEAPVSTFTFQSSIGKKGKAQAQAPAYSGIQAHYGGVTCMKSINNGTGILSCGKEGSVAVWDVRSGGVSVLMQSVNPFGKSRPLLSTALSPTSSLIAAGSELQGEDAVISFFDPRNPSKPLREHTSTHSDDITVLEFAPKGYVLPRADDSDDESGPSGNESGTGEYLLSGSTDGLLNISKANEEDEEEAVLFTANWGCSIAQAGWIYPSSSNRRLGWGVWAGSDMETYSTWTSDLSPVLDFDVREPGVHGEKGVEWVTDYLVGCHSSASSGGLRVFVGSNEGDVSLLSSSNPLRRRKKLVKPWYIHSSYTHSHVGVVRALFVDERNGLIVTGGEDAKLNIWKDVTPSPSALASLYTEVEGDEEEEESDDDDVGMEVDEASQKPVRKKRGASPSDDEMDGRKRRR